LRFHDLLRVNQNRPGQIRGIYRAGGPEYWWFFLFTTLVGTLFSTLSGGDTGSFFGVVSTAVSLALLLPSLAVGVRRLHDIGRSGWYTLFILIPLVGIIILIVWWCRAGDPTDNAFGTAPTPPERPTAA
jgi:uncharacterized membrane protein YhaH (DUF805 family)